MRNLSRPLRLAGLDGTVQMSVDYDHACALRANAVSCWGANGAGQLGDGTRTDPGHVVDVPFFHP